ncbi:hypothetical protein AB0E69_10555 [Kribbella sp. NPDC026611]|uniref:hypothetical protein n=1 Tax=Kribbella sp. NPDC026611 TaxID=3154911 RepID=UPI0033DB9C37
MTEQGGDLWKLRGQGVVVSVRGRVVMPCTVFLLAVAGCSNSDAAGSAPTAPTPSIVVPKTPRVVKAATDCKQSTEKLPAESETDGVQLDVSTDPSGTSLLLKNTGSLTVIVIPDSNFTTRLTAAPYANPKDQSSRAALIAVNNSGGLAMVHEIPGYVPVTQTVTLPPQWAVCALTDDLKEIAGVRYLQDKPSSAEYFVTKGIADQLLAKFAPDKIRPTLIRCAKSALNVLKTHPEMSDVEQYAEILGTRSACRGSYKALLGGKERDAEQLGGTVLNRLQGAPRLEDNSRLYDALARS